jgi:serine protease Do
LVNGQGEVVGINLAILSQTGASIGIGFATPINLVKELLPELQTKGKVTRGWAGLTIQEITPDLAAALGLEKPRGALIADLVAGGPADRGGMKVGDVVTEYDGQEVKEAGEFPIMVARTPVRKKVDVKVLRERNELRLAMTIGELQEPRHPLAPEKSADNGKASAHPTHPWREHGSIIIVAATLPVMSGSSRAAAKSGSFSSV